MIKAMIDDFRIQTNTLELRMEPTDLRAIVQEAVADWQRQRPERTILLEIVHAEKRVPILADADRIRQVLNTFLANALNYSPVHRPVAVQVTVRDFLACVSVQDEGPGIPPEEQAHLWERFYRARGITVQHELDLSLGLDLYICRALIEFHHGQVGVQSVLDHGTTVWFTLPIVVSPSE